MFNRRCFWFAGTFLSLIGLFLMVQGANASSHREAPLISTDPSADNTDVYAFVSPDKPNTVTLIANYIPFEDPAGGPNFHRFADEVKYTIHIDNVGDAQSHIAYEFTFQTQTLNGDTFLYNVGPIGSPTDANRNVQQTYTVTRVDDSGSTSLGSGLTTAPINVGRASTSNYAPLADAAIHEIGDGIQVFVGPRDDPFFADLGAIFDLLTIRPGAPGNMGGGVDGLAGYNCHTLALQIPIGQLTSDGSVPTSGDDSAAVIGVWATASRPATTTYNAGGAPTYSGNLMQVSRLGSPLVNEIVLPLSMKDRWNASLPGDDGQFLNFVTDPEPARLLNLIYGLQVPPTPRNDLVQIFLTGVPGVNQPPNVTPSEQLRLNVAIPPSANPNPLGVIAGDLAGFPNGRRLEDDVIDIALRAVAGVLVEGFNISPNNLLGDGVDRNDRHFLSAFPYMAHPHQGFNHTKYRVEPPAPGLGARLRGARRDAFFSAAVLNADGTPAPAGLNLEFARSISAKISVYTFVGATDRNGQIDITLGPGGNKNASGMYTARLVDGNTVMATWNSIPARAGRHIDLTLQIGHPAKLSSSPAGVITAALNQNNPNPFNPETTIRYELSGPAPVQLIIYNVLGQAVRTLVDGPRSAGFQVARWDGRDDNGVRVSSGLYFYRLAVEGFSEQRKMLLIK